jgi:hypothetical protein
MLWRWRLLGLLIVLAGAAPVVGSADDSSADERDVYARVLRKLKADPEHYARLQRDYKAFYALPVERQEHLRQLDRDLHAAETQTQRHLWDVLERYNAWLEHQSEPDRKRILEAATPGERLKLIREMREQQWLAHLPQKTREELDVSVKDPQKRATILQKARDEERSRRLHWHKNLGPRPGKDKM